MYKLPKSEDTFVKVTQPQVYDTASGQYYYDLSVTVYKKNGFQFTILNEYYESRNNTSKVSYEAKSFETLDDEQYTQKGYSPPRMCFGNYYILADGTVAKLTLDPEVYNLYYKTYAKYNGALAIVRTYDGTDRLYHTDPALGTSTRYYWQKINYLYFDQNGNTVLSEDMEFRVGAVEGLDGYYSNYSTFVEPDGVGTIYANKSVSWWGKCPNSVFPDGRYVVATWEHMTGDLYEIWYNIYQSDGTLIATGPTGYTATFTSAFTKSALTSYTINNSKFVVALGSIINTWGKEYYRYSVTEEGDDGEVIATVKLGEKKILPPDSADTEVVEPIINFGENELPIGYNIKENVIDAGNFESDLRDQVNAIRLNDIVIVAEEGYLSGEQNTGSSLSSFGQYDYTLGNTYIRVYSNGQNFRWYCYYPEQLTPGTYKKTYTIGDKTVYVTFKVIAPPANDVAVTVVF